MYSVFDCDLNHFIIMGYEVWDSRKKRNNINDDNNYADDIQDNSLITPIILLLFSLFHISQHSENIELNQSPTEQNLYDMHERLNVRLNIMFYISLGSC